MDPFASGITMRISARNHIRGVVVEVKKGTITSHVSVDTSGNILTSSIANEALDDLGIKVDDCVSLAIKASDVMNTVD
jgi:molybdopterin-binding protein